MVAANSRMHRLRVRVPDADAVYLMGAFNNWSTTRTPMRRVAEGGWEVVVPASATAGPWRVFVWAVGQRCGRVARLSVDPIIDAPAPAASCASDAACEAPRDALSASDPVPDVPLQAAPPHAGSSAGVQRA